MKMFPTRVVVRVLRRQCGMQPMNHGNGTGHELWSDQHGRTCHPMLRRKDVPYATLYDLGAELESKGVVSRRAFLNAMKAII